MSQSLRRTAPQLMLFTKRRWQRADAITARPASAPTITRIITAPSCSIPTATTSKPFATRLGDDVSTSLMREHCRVAAVIAPAQWRPEMANDTTGRDAERAWNLLGDNPKVALSHRRN